MHFVYKVQEVYMKEMIRKEFEINEQNICRTKSDSSLIYDHTNKLFWTWINVNLVVLIDDHRTHMH